MNAREGGINPAGQQLHRPRLGKARRALNKHMAAAEQADEQPLNQPLKPDEPRLHAGAQSGNPGARAK